MNIGVIASNAARAARMNWLTLLPLLLAVTLPLARADLDILVVGSTHSFSEGGETGVVHENPFDPTHVASELQSILANDPAVTQVVKVVFEDVYRDKTISTAVGGDGTPWTFTYYCFSLAQYFMWPEGKADRMANLRGAGTNAWDYIILCEDPYVMANFPGMYAEGVKLIEDEASQGTAQLVLLGQWPENSSTFTAAQFNEIVHRVGDSIALPVAPAGKVWDSFSSQDTDTSHPTPKGEYLAAATIYSKLMGRNASSSNYSNDNTIADHAWSVVQATDGVAQYSGLYTSPNPFQMKYDRKRHLDYSERGTSTEDGFINGLNESFDVCQMTYAKYSVAIPVDFHFSRGTDIFEVDKQYLVDPALFARSYGFPMQDHGDTGVETMRYGIDKRYEGASYRNGTDLGIAYSMILEGEVAPLYDVRGIPIRLMWSKMYHEFPSLVFAYRNPVSDLWHLSDEMERAAGAFMLALNTGRCPVDAEPGDNTSDAWQRWYGRKIGYETAWQMAHLTARAPGFRVVPTAATANVVTPGASEPLAVRFMNAPASDVTVSISVDDPTAGGVSPSNLTFTAANYDAIQTVTVSAAAGSESGTFPFNVTLTTASDDVVYDGLTDIWDFENERRFAQLSNTNVIVAEDGGTNSFSVVLNWQPGSDVVLDLFSSDTGDVTVSPVSLTFTPGSWDIPQTVTLTGVNDNTLATDTPFITLSVNDPASDDGFDGQPDLIVGVTCVNDDSAGFTLSKSSATVGENGGTDSFTVLLDAEPVSDVVLELTTSSALEATVSPTNLAFNAGNWNSPRTVTLAGIDDFSLGDDTAIITVSIDAGASDNDFAGVPDQTVNVTCTSDEVIGTEGSNTAPIVAPMGGQTISLGEVDPGAPAGEVELASETFGGLNADNLAGTSAETYEAGLGGSGNWAGSTNIKADGYGRGNSVKITYLALGSYINDAKGDADAKFELTATLSQPNEGSGYNCLSFSNLSAPVTGSNASLIAALGYAMSGELIYSTGPGMASPTSAGTFSGNRTVTITLDFSPIYYNGTTTFGRITWSDSAAGILGTSDLTSELDIFSIALVLDATNTGSRTANIFSALSLVKSAASSSASTTLTGSVSDPENNPLTLNWSLVSGPAGFDVIFGDNSALETGATFPSVGDYTIRLTATDNWGAFDSEDFSVSVVSNGVTTVSVTATDAAASETGPDGGEWTVTRTGSTNDALDVLFSLSGTADLVNDYTVTSSNSVTIAAGQSSVTITLTPLDDALTEPGGEIATLTIDADAAYLIGVASDSITIDDNDTASFVVIFDEGAHGSRSGGGALTQQVEYASSAVAPTIQPDPGYQFYGWNTQEYLAVTSNMTVTAQYTENINYTLTYLAGPNGSILGVATQTVAAGSNGTPVTAVADAGHQFVDWSDSSTDNPRTDIAVSSNIAVTANFASEPPPAISFASASSSGYATVTTILVHATLTHISGQTTTVDVAVSPTGTTATAGADFTYSQETLLFEPGETNKTFSFTVLDDDGEEVDETILFKLENFVNGTAGAQDTYQFTILFDTNTWYAVPFLEDFDERTLGELAGQRGWVAQDGIVQDSLTFNGSARAGSITNSSGSIRHSFNDACTRVWTDVRVQVKHSPGTPSLNSGDTVAFYVSTNSQVMVFDGTNAVPAGATVTEGEWARFTVLSDYPSQQWTLYVNGVPAGQFGFYDSAVTSFSDWMIMGDGSHVDNLAVTTVPPLVSAMPTILLFR